MLADITLPSYLFSTSVQSYSTSLITNCCKAENVSSTLLLQTKLLGHVISPWSLQMNIVKVKVVAKWEVTIGCKKKLQHLVLLMSKGTSSEALLA